MLSTELQPHAQELPEERRKASRFRKEPESSYAVLLHPQREEMLAEVHNESLGGLAVFLAGDSAFAVGQELDVIYLGSFSAPRSSAWNPNATAASWSPSIASRCCPASGMIAGRLRSQHRARERWRWERGDRIAKGTPPHQIRLDTKAEENAWNSRILSVAQLLLPDASLTPARGPPRRSFWIFGTVLGWNSATCWSWAATAGRSCPGTAATSG